MTDTVCLAPHSQRIIADQIADGLHETAEDVVAFGLLVLRRKHKRLAMIRENLANGLADAEVENFAPDTPMVAPVAEAVDLAASADLADIRITGSAWAGLGTVVETANRLGGPVYAKALLGTVFSSFAFLRLRPRAGTRRPELGPDLASHLHEGYAIYYIARDRGIDVVGILPRHLDVDLEH